MNITKNCFNYFYKDVFQEAIEMPSRSSWNVASHKIMGGSRLMSYSGKTTEEEMEKMHFLMDICLLNAQSFEAE